MATQVLNSPALNEFEPESASRFMLKDVFSGLVVGPSGSGTRAFPGRIEYHLESSSEDGSCLKGFSVAIVLEAAMVLGLYLIWHVIG
jgi:hypothetical protein